MRNRIWIILLVISLGVNIGFLLHWFWPKLASGHSTAGGQSQSGWHASSMRRGLGLSAEQAQTDGKRAPAGPDPGATAAG